MYSNKVGTITFLIRSTGITIVLSYIGGKIGDIRLPSWNNIMHVYHVLWNWYRHIYYSKSCKFRGRYCRMEEDNTGLATLLLSML